MNKTSDLLSLNLLHAGLLWFIRAAQKACELNSGQIFFSYFSRGDIIILVWCESACEHFGDHCYLTVMLICALFPESRTTAAAAESIDGSLKNELNVILGEMFHLFIHRLLWKQLFSLSDLHHLSSAGDSSPVWAGHVTTSCHITSALRSDKTVQLYYPPHPSGRSGRLWCCWVASVTHIS